MNQQTAYKIMRFFVDGLIPARYHHHIIRWLSDSKDSEAKEEAMKQIWSETSSRMDSRSLDQSFDRFHRQRSVSTVHPVVTNRLGRLLKYAAILTLPILLSLAVWWVTSYQNTKNIALTDFYVSQGRIGTLTLSDGTQVKLNSGSTLSYPQHFSTFAHSREVYLDGEAFFKVTHQSKQPFIVHIGNLKVKVLGTQFNIKAYPAEENITTTLAQGKVLVYENKQAMTILPDEQVVYNRVNGMMKKQRVENYDYSQWMHGRLYFNQAPLKTIIADLQRRYNIRLNIASDVDLSQKYTMAFREDETIDDVMHVLCNISDHLHFTKQNNIIIIYTKKGGRQADIHK
ncbi:FecR family protein [Hoylesella timonensis]|uniref:FecR family protein n=1 Tax=Hoylesella timonensis TaxID=386414 RepID=UPI002432823E|nr:FecR domain-containing protein [Hoylesella timonensis]